METEIFVGYKALGKKILRSWDWEHKIEEQTLEKLFWAKTLAEKNLVVNLENFKVL